MKKIIKSVPIYLVAYFASLANISVGGNIVYLDHISQVTYTIYKFQMQKVIDEKYNSATKEISGINRVLEDKKPDKGIGKNQSGENIEDIDPRDGYPFKSYPDYPIVKGVLGQGYNNSQEDTVKIKDFMYSNYTLTGVPYKDINYVKFWYDGNSTYNTQKPKVIKKKNTEQETIELEQLFQYKAGDMNISTQCTYSDYEGKAAVSKYRGQLIEDDRLSLGNGHKLVTINNRIIAAFPPALFSEEGNIYFDEIRKNMHIVKNYAAPHDDMKDGGNYKDSNLISGKEATDTYKLVDVVIEDENGQQFVVPFVVIDSKSIHLISRFEGVEKLGNFAHLTDNRYGHVIEIIDETNPVEYDKQYYYHVVNEADHLDRYDWVPEEGKQNIDSNEQLQEYFTDTGKRRAYYDKDNKRKARRVSAIEPYISLVKGADGKAINANSDTMNKTITSVICGKGISTSKPNCRIVSMRIYDEKCADASGNPIVGKWDNRQGEIEFRLNYFEELTRNDSNRKNIIVQYR